MAKLIKVAPEEIVLKAIDALKEALAATKVRNASGFLVEAGIPGFLMRDMSRK